MKGRVIILVCDASSHPILHFCQTPSKYLERVFKLHSGHKINLKKKKKKGDNYKNKKPELSFLYVAHHLVECYISTKYHKIFQRVFNLQYGHEINA